MGYEEGLGGQRQARLMGKIWQMEHDMKKYELIYFLKKTGKIFFKC